MRSAAARRLGGWTFVGLALLAASPVLLFAQRPQADCPGSLVAYVGDRSLNARWGDSAHTYVIMVRGGVEYICRCPSNTQPPVCTKKGSSGSGGFEGVDLSQFSPGQQMALMATQSLLQGLFSGIFSGPSKVTAAEDAVRAQQDMLRKQEEERQQALESWNIFQQEEAKRIEAEKSAARKSGDELLGKMGSSGGQGLGFESVGGQGLEFESWAAEKPGAKPVASEMYPAPRSAAEQARCAAYFSDEALKLDKAGKHEEAAFMNLQAQKAMAGGPTDVPCPGGPSTPAPETAAKGTNTTAVDVNAVLELYNAKIQDLFAISQKLAEVRKQKIDAQLDIRQSETRIADIKVKAATVTTPEEKKEVDDLLSQALALKGESEQRLKIAEENENACLADAKKAEDAVKELDSTLKKGPGDK
jgi:hypothetical protein